MKIDRSTATALRDLERQALSWRDVGPAALQLVSQAIPYDSASWFALDPSTLLPTRFDQHIVDPLLQEFNDNVTTM